MDSSDAIQLAVLLLLLGLSAFFSSAETALTTVNKIRVLTLVEEGDIISINIPEMKLDVKVSEEEMAVRKDKWQPREPKVTTGYLARYRGLVTSGNRGAILEIPGQK